MDFQIQFLVWSIALLVSWYCFIFLYPAAYLVGTAPIDNPLRICEAVHEEADMRDTLIKAKAGFIALAYISTTAYVWINAARQRRTFRLLNKQTTSMKDFCAQLTGFPQESGKDLEKSMTTWMTKKFQSLGGQHVTLVGLSISWDMLEREGEGLKVFDDLQNLIDDEAATHELYP